MAQAGHKAGQIIKLRSNSCCSKAFFDTFRQSEVALIEEISVSFYTFHMPGSDASFLGGSELGSDSLKQSSASSFPLMCDSLSEKWLKKFCPLTTVLSL